MRADPRAVRSYVNLGSLYWRKGQPERAVELYEEAAKRGPRVTLVHRQLAELYLELGRPERALSPELLEQVRTALRAREGHP
jgi:lipopolysaccharide biosynthesis regulator YciM